jgi:hypothetical protein
MIPAGSSTHDKLLFSLALICLNWEGLSTYRSAKICSNSWGRLSFGGLVASAGIKLYQWQPEEDWEKVVRQLLLVGCGSYLVHLIADSFTPRGLPAIGKV